jgi:hypothetical protein
MVGDLVKRVFDGAASALMLNLLADEGFSEGEREELSQLISTYRPLRCAAPFIWRV